MSGGESLVELSDDDESASPTPTESLSSSDSPRGGYGYYGTAQHRRDSSTAVAQGWANLRTDA
eukprot:2121271-Alexandrium_andersonii.AAC.1